jgi:CSLREA domain-containing protein
LSGRKIGLLVAVATAAIAPSAQAATITVSTTSDQIGADGVCSLREAVIAANIDTAGPGNDCTAGNGADTVSVPGGGYKLSIAATGTDDAASGDLNITQPATLSGAGAASTQVDGRGIDRVFAVGATGVQISGLTITGGDAGNGNGGGIAVSNVGSLTLMGSIVTANKAYSGGGIANTGQVVISDSTVSHNDGMSGGGGIYNSGQSMVIERTEVLNNTARRAGGVFENDGNLTAVGGSVSDNGSATTTMQGGGLEIDGGPTSLTDVRVTGNVANNVGAGILSDARPAEETTLVRTEVSGNELVSSGNLVRGAAIYVSGAITLTDSWVHDNSGLNGEGGGIFFQPRNADEPLQIEGSTIGPSNRATEGDGIFADGAAVAITRSTIAGNGDDLDSGYGGGLYVGSGTTATLRDDTLAENKASNSTGGGNLYAQDNSTLLWQNTLIARPFGGGNCEHGSTATITSEGGDQEYGDPEHMCGFTHAGDIATSGDLDTTQLGALQNYGGPTETMALLPGAAPVDTGTGCRPIDQRGVPRPQGSACDSGAYELDTAPPGVSITSGPSGTVSTSVVSFTFAADEPALFECELDGASLAPCSSPFTSESLSDGSHNFVVRAADIAGNVGAATSRTFTIAPISTSTSLGASNTVPLIGEAITLIATVTPQVGGEGAPAGFIEFLDGVQPIAGCASKSLVLGPTSSTATCSVGFPASGPHSIVALYSGDQTFEESQSNPISISVHEPPPPGGGPASTSPVLSLAVTGSPPPGPTGKRAAELKKCKKKKRKARARCVKHARKLPI